jgi:aspartyl-tRNA synthetase
MERTLVRETLQKVGQQITLKGWVANHRVMGKMTFVDLRDKSGKVQCVGYEMMKDLTMESVIEIIGEVKQRPEKQYNSEMETGTVEIEVKEYKLLNKADPLPIPVAGDGKDINEDARLKYRYLDLRRERVNKIMRVRSEFIRSLRDSLYDYDFTEVETPMLSKATMEGARDFIVPSRLHPGKFYALPQSPQQYKQLLMTGGIDRYFQVAKCIRDEDLRADRGFEFTQLDLEMSFATRDDVLNTVEDVVKKAVKSVGGVLKDEKFPVINYEEAISKYGADKFDIRSDEEKEKGVLAFAWVVNFPFFKKVDKADAAEVRDGKSGWTFTHNPFSIPIEEHIEWHLKGENIDKIVTNQYDLVCNGYEAGGGSIRAHDPEILRATYKIMGYSDEEIEKSIGHMLEAFKLGTPPHGGIALGIDRLVMLLTGETSVKETIAFPMTYNGRTAIMEGPSEIKPEQLKDLGIEVVKKVKG